MLHSFRKTKFSIQKELATESNFTPTIKPSISGYRHFLNVSHPFGDPRWLW